MEQGPELRAPKQEITDTRNRFMDYIGNAMNGLLGELMMYEDRPEERETREERVKEYLGHLFERVKIFSESDFEKTDKINKENLQTFSDFKERVFEDFSVIEDMDTYYHSLTEKQERPQKVELQFGLPSHESEYVLTTPYTDDDVPWDWEDTIKKKLGDDWDVMHRQTRIEIRRKNLEHLDGDDELIRSVVGNVIDSKYSL